MILGPTEGVTDSSFEETIINCKSWVLVQNQDEQVPYLVILGSAYHMVKREHISTKRSTASIKHYQKLTAIINKYVYTH